MKWSDLTQYGYKGEEEHSVLPMGDEAEFLQEIVALILPPEASLEDEIDPSGAEYAVHRFYQLSADDINFVIEDRRDQYKGNLDDVYTQHPWLEFYKSDAQKEDRLTSREAQSWGLYLYYQQIAYILRDQLEALCS